MHFTADRQLVEISAGQVVAVEIEFPAIRRFDKTETVRKDSGDPAMQVAFMELDVTALAPPVILQLAPGRVECVAAPHTCLHAGRD